jgi:hypothetical protein
MVRPPQNNRLGLARRGPKSTRPSMCCVEDQPVPVPDALPGRAVFAVCAVRIVLAKTRRLGLLGSGSGRTPPPIFVLNIGFWRFLVFPGPRVVVVDLSVLREHENWKRTRRFGCACDVGTGIRERGRNFGTRQPLSRGWIPPALSTASPPFGACLGLARTRSGHLNFCRHPRLPGSLPSSTTGSL